MKLQIQALSEKIGRAIPLPYYATEGAAAVDLHACLDAPETIAPGDRALIPTGLAFAIPAGHVGLVAIRSSMGIRRGITLANGVGVIDSDYRGQVHVGLLNTSGAPYTVNPGDRVAQLMVVPVAAPEIELVEALPETERGAGGIGSTGR